jgi:hypothetical protein
LPVPKGPEPMGSGLRATKRRQPPSRPFILDPHFGKLFRTLSPSELESMRSDFTRRRETPAGSAQHPGGLLVRTPACPSEGAGLETRKGNDEPGTELHPQGASLGISTSTPNEL